MLSHRDVGLISRGGTARNYTDVITGEIVSRREADKRVDAARTRESAVRESYLHRQAAKLERNTKYPGVFKKYYESRVKRGYDGTEQQGQAEPSWIRFEERMSRPVPSKRTEKSRERRRDELKAKAKYLQDFAMDWDFEVGDREYEEVMT